MAKYWDCLKYHEDTVKKRPITCEELDFLIELQKEMNTQDHCGTADPRYWVIRDYNKVYGENLSSTDGICLYDSEGVCEIYDGDYSEDDILNALREQYEDDFCGDELNLYFDPKESLKEYLEENGYDFIEVLEYELSPVEHGFFLTESAARKHLKENEHHYSEDAHTYCKCAWRCEETKYLWEILEKVDFANLKEVIE